MKELLKLYITFLRIGLLCFGGGYAILPILEKEIIKNHAWATQEEIMDYFAIGQCTPGLIAVNIATFIGNKRKGIMGGIIATLGFATPSVIIILILSVLLQNFADYTLVKHAFAGIRVAVSILVLNTVLSMWKSSVVDFISFCIFAAVFLISLFTSVTPIIPILASAIAGIAIKSINQNKPDTFTKNNSDKSDNNGGN